MNVENKMNLQIKHSGAKTFILKSTNILKNLGLMLSAIIVPNVTMVRTDIGPDVRPNIIVIGPMQDLMLLW